MNSISTLKSVFGLSLDSLLKYFAIGRRKICKITFVFGIPSTIVIILTCCLLFVFSPCDVRKEFLPLELMWNSSAYISLKMTGITENIEERVKRFNSQNRHSYYFLLFIVSFSYTWFTYKHPLISIYELRGFMSVMTETSSNSVLAVSLH